MLLALSLGVCLLGKDARAAERFSAATSHRLIVGTPKGDTGILPESLMSALDSQLAELGVLVESAETSLEEGFDPPASEEKVLAFVWVVREGEALSVHFLEAAGASIRQRRLPLSAADSSSAEEVAVVVRSAVAALLDRMNEWEDDSLDTPQPVAEIEMPALIPASRSRYRPLLLSLGYTAQSYAPELGFAQGGIVDAAIRPFPGVLVVGGNYSFLAAQEHSAGEVSISLRRHPGEFYTGVDTRDAHQTLFLLAHAGLSLDFVRRKTLETTSLNVEPDTTRTSWALIVRSGVGLELSSSFSIAVLCGADVLLARVPVAIDAGDTEQTILNPYRVRPRLIAQVSWLLP